MPGEEVSDQKVIVLAGVGAAGAGIAEALVRSIAEDFALLLIDRDRHIFEHNVPKTATLYAGDVGGGAKARVVARRLRQIRPRRRIYAFAAAVEQAGAGPFRLAHTAANILVIDAVDRLDAQLHITQLASAAGVARMISARLEGGPSPAAALRIFAPGQGGPCPICAWGDEERSLLNRQNRPCSTAGEVPHPSGFAGPLHLAAEVLAAVEQWLHDPQSLTPGEEIRLIPQARRYLSLRSSANAQCPLAPHSAWPRWDMDGSVATFTVGDFLAAVELRIGNGWSWPLAQPAFHAACPACGRAALVLRPDLGGRSPLCPACAHRLEVIGAGQLLHELAAADLDPAVHQLLAGLWPAGDIIRLAVPGGDVVNVGLPVDGLFDWFVQAEEADT
jgi:hypothetical protein